MSINTYKIFVTVTEQGSFLKASHLLNITPSAISHAIAGMESDFGYPLLIRNKTGVTLTSYGESLLPYIRAVLNSEAILLQQAAALNGLKTGTVRLGSFNSICTTHLPKLIQAFHEQYPNIKVQIYQGTYNDVIEWLKSGVVEIGFLSKESAENKLPIHPVYKDEILCIVPKDFEVTDASFITHEEINRHELIAQQESTASDIKNYLQKYHLKVKTSCYASDDLTAVSLVSNGFGICLMPELVLQSLHYPVDCYCLQPKGYRTIGLSCMDKAALSPAAKRLYNFIINAYEDNWFHEDTSHQK